MFLALAFHDYRFNYTLSMFKPITMAKLNLARKWVQDAFGRDFGVGMGGESVEGYEMYLHRLKRFISQKERRDK